MTGGLGSPSVLNERRPHCHACEISRISHIIPYMQKLVVTYPTLLYPPPTHSLPILLILLPTFSSGSVAVPVEFVVAGRLRWRRRDERAEDDKDGEDENNKPDNLEDEAQSLKKVAEVSGDAGENAREWHLGWTDGMSRRW